MKRKGFTLIELLAVIVILAVIAIITIPLIGNIIDTAKRGALGASANGIIESAELYYSTKMLENPETKTFTCSKEGCVSGEERLDYKGEVTEGRIILYADGKTSICIEDGKNAALKLANQTEVTTEEGSCNYDSEDYSIDATVSKTKYNEVVEELTEGKKVISEAITNKGVETSETDTFPVMADNINQISTGDLEKSKLLEALQYSELGLTADSTSEEIYSALKKEFPPKSLYIIENGVIRDATFVRAYSYNGYNQGNLSTSYEDGKYVISSTNGLSWAYFAWASSTLIESSNYTTLNFEIEISGDNNMSYVMVGYTNSDITGIKGAWEMTQYKDIDDPISAIISIPLYDDYIYPFILPHAVETTLTIKIANMWLE